MSALGGPTASVWVLMGLLLLVAFAARAARVVGDDERLVVHRLGRVAGVRGPGFTVVWPMLERDERVPLRLVGLDLFVDEAVTRDGVSVRLRAAALASVEDPVRYATAVESPLTATTIAAESALRREVARRDLAELPALVASGGSDLAGEAGEATREWGVRLTRIDVAGIDVPLSGDLIAWGERRRQPLAA